MHPVGRRPVRPLFAFNLAGGLCAALLACNGARAVDALEKAGTDDIVVTAARVGQPLGDALPSVTILTRADIAATQSRDLVELLGRQVGVEFARNGGQGAQSSLFLRGSNSNQVLVLVDGVRLNSVLGGAANLAGVATDSIERVEIVRGNLSSLYGSEAMGGVVQIFTRAGSSAGADALVEAGQGRTRDASAGVRVPLADALLSLYVGTRAQAAVSAIDAAQVAAANPDIDGTRNRNGSLRIAQRGAGGDFSAWAWGNHSDTDWDDPYDSSAQVPSTAATQVEHDSLYGYGFSGTRVLGASRLGASMAVTRDDSANASNVPNSYDNNEFRSRNRQTTIQDTTTLARGIDWNLGVEQLDQRGGSSAFDPNFNNVLTQFSRRVQSLWTGTTGRRGDLQWQANIRRDRFSDAGSASTGLLGGGWWLDAHWKLTAQAATAFRAPSFNELYYPMFGNPGLRPERARSVELGLRWVDGPASASVTAFRNRTSGLIEGLAPDYVPRNVAHAAVDGSEWQAATTLGPLRLGASLDLDRARDLDTGLALLRRAHYNAKASAAYVQGRWDANAQIQRSGARDDYGIVSGARVSLPAYDLARMTLAREVAAGVHVHLRVENLFNARYRLVDGYNTLPRMIIAGAEASF